MPITSGLYKPGVMLISNVYLMFHLRLYRQSIGITLLFLQKPQKIPEKDTFWPQLGRQTLRWGATATFEEGLMETAVLVLIASGLVLLAALLIEGDHQVRKRRRRDE